MKVIKKILLIESFWFGMLIVNAQKIGINYQLADQISRNQGVRYLSEYHIKKTYRSQRKMYQNINKKLIAVVGIHQKLYDNLKNVNSAIKQGKRLMLFKDYILRISKNAQVMLKESKKNAKYTALFSDLYIKIIEKSVELSTEVSSNILNEDKDFLMDAYDREMLISKMFQKADELNGYILLITAQLKRANQIGFWRSVPILNTWVSQDKIIVNEILDKYKYAF